MNSLESYQKKIKRITKYTLVLELLFTIGLITPYTTVFLGLMLGTAVSLINSLYTAWKINRIGELAQKNKDNKKMKYSSTGMLTRMALSVLAVFLVIEYPQYFNLYSTLIGLFITQIISVVDSIRSN